MQKFLIEGGTKLSGEITVSGSKNAALPIICASLLTKEKVILENIPAIEDVFSMIKIIESLDVRTEFKNNVLTIDPSGIKNKHIPDEYIIKMRASILMIGALLPRFKYVKMAFPGGCVLGKRSVASHTHAFREMGCKIVDEKNNLEIKVNKLRGKKIILPELSVTATENTIMTAVLAEGQTEIRLAAAEPHVQDFCMFLKRMGAKIAGIGTNTIKITGVKHLKGCRYKITGDYLEAGTLVLAAVATKGEVIIKGINTNHLDSFWQKLKETGANFKLGKTFVHILPSKKLNAVKILRTAVYPSFPTDLQAPFAVLLTGARGVSKIFETLFEGRLNYLFELEKMGAHIEYLNPYQAIIIGPTKLKAMPISSCDIRAGAAMVIAALMANGETEISNINYIDRGYENFEEKLKLMGAKIKRLT